MKIVIHDKNSLRLYKIIKEYLIFKMGGDIPKQGDSPKPNIYYTKFESPCPVCKNNNNIYWVHSSDNSHQTISNQGDIKCNNTNCFYFNKPLFIMNWAFNCGEHKKQYGEDFIKPGKTRAINAIHMLANNSDLNFTQEEEDYITEKILRYK